MTEPKIIYEWHRVKDHHGVQWFLSPQGLKSPWTFGTIATVFYLGGSKQWHGSYQYFVSTGAPNAATVVRGSTLSARRWIERQLGQFWEPPEIANPA